ncbi:MAG: hypothetical protein LKF52_05705 [Butyrivibrio sp.]|jgi:hypothetical protein|nr:hypothetical protein [Butyrivibrio sp.]
MLVNHEEDFKYFMQDIEKIYLGARYSYHELMENELVPFKFRTIIERYLIKELDPETTLESHFYYMKRSDAEYRAYRQLKTRVRVSQYKKTIIRQKNPTYTEKVYTLEQLAAIPPEEKQKQGMVVREVILSKLSLFAFSV